MSVSSFQFVAAEQIKRGRELLRIDHAMQCGRERSRRSQVGPREGCESWTCTWSPDGSYLAWSAGHRSVHLIPCRHERTNQETDEDYQYHIIDCGELVHSLAFGQTTKHFHRQQWKRQHVDTAVLILATGHFRGHIKLWNCDSGLLLVEISDHKNIIHDLHFSQDNALHLASASRDGSVKLWEFDAQGDSNMYLTVPTNAKHAFTCRWSPDSTFLVAAGSFKTALLLKMKGRKVEWRHSLQGHHHDVVHCDFSPDGALLATASFDTQVILWDVYTRAALAKLGHMYPSPRPIYAGGVNDHYVYCVKFSPEGSRLASVGEDGYVRLWQLPDLSDPVTIATVDSPRCCSFSADGHRLAVGSLTGSLTVLATPHQVDTLLLTCRRAVRSAFPSHRINDLPLPNHLKSFLQYNDVASDWTHR